MILRLAEKCVGQDIDNVELPILLLSKVKEEMEETYLHINSNHNRHHHSFMEYDAISFECGNFANV